MDIWGVFKWEPAGSSLAWVRVRFLDEARLFWNHALTVFVSL
jgi:hypothetical protein